MSQEFSHTEFLKGLEDLYILEPGSLRSDLMLEDLREWNSLGKVEFMAFADENYRVEISGEQLRRCRFIADLEALVSSPVPDTNNER